MKKRVTPSLFSTNNLFSHVNKIFQNVFFVFWLYSLLVLFHQWDVQFFDTLQRTIVFLRWLPKAYNLSVFLTSNISIKWEQQQFR